MMRPVNLKKYSGTYDDDHEQHEAKHHSCHQSNNLSESCQELLLIQLLCNFSNVGICEQ